MSQLMGTENESVRKFVQDVCRFHSGETILPSRENAGKEEAKPSEPSSTKTKSVPKVGAKTSNIRERRGRGGTRTKTPPKKKNSGMATSKAASGNTPNMNTVGVQQAGDAGERKPQSSATIKKLPDSISVESATKIVIPPAKKKAPPPPRGKATIVCGCFGTKHKCLTNCLNCGRISCQREGYSYCPFCGFLVQEFKATADTSR